MLFSPDGAYPGENNAFAVMAGGSIFVLNSHENVDEPAPFTLDLEDPDIRRVKGEMHLLNYLIGKREGSGRFWFQANSYCARAGTMERKFSPEARSTAVTFVCARRPRLAVTPRGALVGSRWDDARKELRLEVNHEAGAVEFTLSNAH